MKIPKAKKMPSGKWRIQLRLQGQSITITREDKKECELEAFMIKAKATGSKLAPKATLNEIVDIFITARSNVLSPSTVNGYREIQRNRFKDYHNARIDKNFDFQTMINQEAKKISPKTLQNAWGLVRSSLEYSGIPVPKVRLAQKVESDSDFYDFEEISEIVKALEGDLHELPILLALHSLRVSEIRALTKEQCKNGVMRVRGAVVRSEDGMSHKPTNKTSAGTRDIPIFIPRLKELIDVAPPGPLLRVNSNTVMKHFKRFCRWNGFRYITWHPLRHSFCSLCHHLQIPELEVMKMGGWDDVNTMRKIYTHISDREEMIANEKLSNFFK